MASQESWSVEDEQLHSAACLCWRPGIMTWLSRGGRPGVLVGEDTALIGAASRGYDEALKLLLTVCAKQDLEARDQEGWTALMRASNHTNADCVKLLLAAGADPDAAGADGYGCVYLAACGGSVEVLGALLDAGASARTPSGVDQSALAGAARIGSWGCIEKLLAAGGGVDDAGSSGTTALMVAVQNCEVALAARLLDLGADPMARDEDGRTACKQAQEYGTVEIEKLLAGVARSRMERVELARSCEMVGCANPQAKRRGL